ncbi:MAG TPA: efflux RND transporter periplasmic adaptor subunit [Rhodopila sp.]|jgi:RND family efflux transporter MFP subunit
MSPNDLHDLHDLGQMDGPAPYRSPGARPAVRRPGRTGPLLAALVIVVAGIAIYVGIRSRSQSEAVLARETNEAAVPAVEVIHPKPDAPDSKLELPGNTQPFSDAAIYARTNGYLKHWYFDIGAHVKRGDLMAEIETPEVDDQLRQAWADLANAQATLKLAAVTAERKESLLKTGFAPVQDRDNAVGALDVAKAMVRSREAAVAQLAQMQSFERVEAPFDGIVTARTVDVGALIAAGGATSARELFHLVATDTLRIYVSVPESYSQAVHVGAAVTVTLDEFPGETFSGTLVRTANAIDQSSRTLLVEVDVPNKDGRLLSGSYVHVHFVIPTSGKAVTIPANALLFRKEGLQVGVVRDSKVELVPVKIGHDFGDTVEVISGLQATDQIVANPPDSLTSGTTVLVKTKPEAPAAK